MAKKTPDKSAKDPLRQGLSALPPGTTVVEMAKKASVSSTTIGQIQNGTFKTRIAKLLEKKTVDVRLYRGLIKSLTRVSTFLGLDPLATATAYGFPDDETLANALDAARSEPKSPVTLSHEPNFEETLSACQPVDLDVTISVGSPKGGVGKTLFLIHAGLIQAIGCRWAGIDSKFTLLMDFDFNAPGLHTFPLRNAGEWMEQEWFYRTQVEDNLSQKDLGLSLRKEPIGLVFLLNSISETAAYSECENLLLGSGASAGFDLAVRKMAAYLLEQCNHPESQTCLLRHIVSIIDGSREPKLALMPAGSPHNSSYYQQVNQLVWPKRIAQGMGIVLEKALLQTTVAIGKDDGPEAAKRLIKPIKKIWIDQGAGEFGNVSDANRRIGSRHVQVSSLGVQSSAALEGSIARMNRADLAKMWVVLTYYRGRPLQTRGLTHFADALTFAAIDRAEQEFEEADRERKVVVEALVKGGVEKDRITIIDFDPTLVNSPDLRKPGSVYFDCVVRVLASMNRLKRTSANEPIVLERNRDLMILGEYCGNPHSKTEEPAGVLHSFHTWIGSQLPNHLRIRTIAASHEQIARMAGGETVSLVLEDGLSDGRIERAYASKAAARRPVVKEFKLSDFDIAAIPSYACDDGKDLLNRFPLNRITSLDVWSSDCIGPIGHEYLSRNIHGWKRAECSKEPSSIRGIPFFSHFQLIVSNSDAFSFEVFQSEFRRRAHKQFAALLSFADIRNAAIVAREAKLKECLLVTVTDPIARFYDWLTVLGIAGCDPFKQTDGFRDARVFESTLDYALLDYLARDPQESQQHVDWNEALARITTGRAGFTFVWPDAIPNYLRDHPKLQYSPIPAVKQLTESWLLVVPNRDRECVARSDVLWKTLIQFLTLEEQLGFCQNGAVPVHGAVANDLAVWRDSPYVKTLGFIRALMPAEDAIEIPERFTVQKLLDLGRALADFCSEYARVISSIQTEKLEWDWRTAIRLSQDSRGEISKSLRHSWETKVDELQKEVLS